MQPIITKPILIGAERNNNNRKLCFFDPIALETELGDDGELADSTRMKLRAWLTALERNSKGKPWLTYNEADLPFNVSHGLWHIRHRLFGRAPQQGPASIVWDGPESDAREPSVTAGYYVDGFPAEVNVSDLKPYLRDVEALAINLDAALFRFVPGAAPEITAVKYSVVMAQGDMHFQPWLIDGAWTHRTNEAELLDEVRGMPHKGVFNYDPRVIQQAQIKELNPIMADRAMAVLGPHLPQAPDAPPPVTWDYV